MQKINFIDLFSGCGGLSEGFKKTGSYNMLAAVEWEKPQVKTLVHRLKTKWMYEDADKRVLHFDIQRFDELISGWSDDIKFGSHEGLDKLIGNQSVDLIIGGPPCQAYSLAGRIRDKNGMKDDYRNYLFESYMKMVRHYRPKLFVFENVPGILSAAPGGVPVPQLIAEDIERSGYHVVDDFRKYAQIDMTEYGVPQKRKRIIIVGIRKDLVESPENTLEYFYTTILPKYKTRQKTVRDAIGDLPPLYPLSNDLMDTKKRMSHVINTEIPNHLPRYHNERDINIFRILTEDIESGSLAYVSTSKLKELYTEWTGKTSNVHKYYVLRWNETSNTIPAHLYKDGLRHIHPDPKQARSITVREAARLQTFPDDFEFICSAGDNYKMIGNAVPPLFSEKLSKAVLELKLF